jgi:hypothetical protein
VVDGVTVETRGGDADYGKRPTIQPDRSSDDVSIGIELCPPESVADDDDCRGIGW